MAINSLAIVALFGGLVLLSLTGVPIAFCLGLTSALVLVFYEGFDALAAVSSIAYEVTTGYVLTAVPLFILMGEFIFRSGIGGDIYNTASKWMGRLPGGMSSATSVASGVFGAICGVSVAGAATIGVVAIPEMRRLGYRTDLCFGAVGSGGALAVMIPPSVVFILYGEITSTSIGKLFFAGVVPGILLVILYVIYATIIGITSPRAAPRSQPTSWAEKLASLKSVISPMVLIILVLGSIYTGLATPTEAAAVGALGAFFLMLIQKRSTGYLEVFPALREAVTVSSMVFAVIIGAMLLSYVSTLLYIPQALTALIISFNLNRWIVLALIWIMLLVLGMFVDGSSLVLLSTPLAFPVITALGWDPIWYGVLLVLNVEIAVLTPPVALNLYVLKGLAPDVPMWTIAKGCLPYVLIDNMAAVLIMLFPQIALWLPTSVK